MKLNQRRRAQWRAYSGVGAAFKNEIEAGAKEKVSFSGNVNVTTKAKTASGLWVRD
jgi:hypothetical protein